MQEEEQPDDDGGPEAQPAPAQGDEQQEPDRVEKLVALGFDRTVAEAAAQIFAGVSVTPGAVQEEEQHDEDGEGARQREFFPGMRAEIAPEDSDADITIRFDASMFH